MDVSAEREVSLLTIVEMRSVAFIVTAGLGLEISIWSPDIDDDVRSVVNAGSRVVFSMAEPLSVELSAETSVLWPAR